MTCMTQWRVSPEGERQYLGEDGYWYVAPIPPSDHVRVDDAQHDGVSEEREDSIASEEQRDWDDDDKLLRGTLGVVAGGLMGVGRRRGSDVDILVSEDQRRWEEKERRREDKVQRKAARGRNHIAAVYYDTPEWTNRQRAAFTEVLLDSAIPHRWNGGELSVDASYEEMCDELFDQGVE